MKEAWTLTLIKVVWPALGALLTLTTIVLTFGWPDRMAAWTPALALLLGLDAAMGAAAFGGPAVRRAQETIASVEGK